MATVTTIVSPTPRRGILVRSESSDCIAKRCGSSVKWALKEVQSVFEVDDWDRSPCPVTPKLTYRDLVELKQLELDKVPQSPFASLRDLPMPIGLPRVRVGLQPIFDTSTSPSSATSDAPPTPNATPVPTPPQADSPPHSPPSSYHELRNNSSSSSATTGALSRGRSFNSLTSLHHTPSSYSGPGTSSPIRKSFVASSAANNLAKIPGQPSTSPFSSPASSRSSSPSRGSTNNVYSNSSNTTNVNARTTHVSSSPLSSSSMIITFATPMLSSTANKLSAEVGPTTSHSSLNSKSTTPQPQSQSHPALELASALLSQEPRPDIASSPASPSSVKAVLGSPASSVGVSLNKGGVIGRRRSDSNAGNPNTAAPMSMASNEPVAAVASPSPSVVVEFTPSSSGTSTPTALASGSPLPSSSISASFPNSRLALPPVIPGGLARKHEKKKLSFSFTPLLPPTPPTPTGPSSNDVVESRKEGEDLPMMMTDVEKEKVVMVLNDEILPKTVLVEDAGVVSVALHEAKLSSSSSPPVAPSIFVAYPSPSSLPNNDDDHHHSLLAKHKALAIDTLALPTPPPSEADTDSATLHDHEGEDGDGDCASTVHDSEFGGHHSDRDHDHDHEEYHSDVYHDRDTEDLDHPDERFEDGDAINSDTTSHKTEKAYAEPDEPEEPDPRRRLEEALSRGNEEGLINKGDDEDLVMTHAPKTLTSVPEIVHDALEGKISSPTSSTFPPSIIDLSSSSPLNGGGVLGELLDGDVNVRVAEFEGRRDVASLSGLDDIAESSSEEDEGGSAGRGRVPRGSLITSDGNAAAAYTASSSWCG